ncbi:hypothetical protein EUTSA_v10028190mg [Eutrema salsugineum]|uniref:RING-type E3 ubiquitin transferase n=1 Tax=Eutrema salsugineum TaxID=72664 RepID=V4LTW3_EUTSA|nr:E3 ubiquitin-protein ligase SINA-like 10 [Eutrema salsugineum]ESQ47264.1 hypothetical protein EUTSA_v10028190mg [Eutrema salsugineum]
MRNLSLAREQPSVQEEATLGHDKRFIKIAEEAADSTREDSNVSVYLLDKDLLECPTCCEPLTIPIYQCINGHIACSLCCKRVNNICPSCKFRVGYIRCRAMEKVIEEARVSCPNAKYGCKENVSYQNPSSHDKQCGFAPCSCPVRDCNYTGSHKDLKNHVNVEHKEGLVLFKWNTPLCIEPTLLSEEMTILREEKDGDLIVIQGFEGTDGIFVTLSCIAPLANEKVILSCSLELRTLRSTLKQEVTVKTIQKTSEEEPEEDFVLVPSYMRNGTYFLEISISRCWFTYFIA